MITIKSEKSNFGIILPTSLKEINADTLSILTDNIKLPKYYCIVALCFKTTLFDFVAINKNSKDASIMVIPIMAKISEEDSKTINANVGDKLIIDRSSLERSFHINIPTVVSTSNIKRYIDNDDDLRKAILRGKYNIKTSNDNIIDINKNNCNIYILEFKIVAINDIHASIPVDKNIIDPFLSVDNENVDNIGANAENNKE